MNEGEREARPVDTNTCHRCGHSKWEHRTPEPDPEDNTPGFETCCEQPFCECPGYVATLVDAPAEPAASVERGARQFEPDSTHRGLRINQAGNGTWQACLDYDDSPVGRFYILKTGMPSRKAAENWINKLAERMRPPSPTSSARLGCMDCGLPYSDFPLDSTLSNDEWALIHDSEGGLLCANCMVKRIHDRVPGVVAVRMRIAYDGKGCDDCRKGGLK